MPYTGPVQKGFAHLGLLAVMVLIVVVGSVGALTSYLENGNTQGAVLGKNKADRVSPEADEPDDFEEAEQIEEQEIEDEVEVEVEDEDEDDKVSTKPGEFKLKIEDDGKQELEVQQDKVKLKIKTEGTASGSRAKVEVEAGSQTELNQIFASLQSFFSNLFQKLSL